MVMFRDIIGDMTCIMYFLCVITVVCNIKDFLCLVTLGLSSVYVVSLV